MPNDPVAKFAESLLTTSASSESQIGCVTWEEFVKVYNATARDYGHGALTDGVSYSNPAKDKDLTLLELANSNEFNQDERTPPKRATPAATSPSSQSEHPTSLKKVLKDEDNGTTLWSMEEEDQLNHIDQLLDTPPPSGTAPPPPSPPPPTNQAATPKRSVVMSTAMVTPLPTAATTDKEGQGSERKSWAEEEQAINALQQRVHQSHFQKDVAKASVEARQSSKRRSRHSSVLMMVEQALEVCRDSSTPTPPPPTPPATEEATINALQQRVHESHFQKEVAKASGEARQSSKHRSKHSQVLMMVGQALEVCRDSSTPTSPRPTTIPTTPSAPAPPAPPAPPTLPAPPAPPTNGNGTSAEWTTPAISFESMNLDREHLTEMDRAIIQEYMDEQQQQEQQEQLEQQYQDEIFAIDVICDDLNGKIDFEQPDIIQMIHLIKQIELAIDSGDTPKIVMLEAEVHAILSTTTTRGVRRMHFMWEEYFQHKAPPKKVATNTRFQMNQFGKNDSNKPRWNNSGHTTHVGRPNSNSSSTHRHIDQTPVTAPSGAFPSSFSSPPPAAAALVTHTSVSFNPGMYGDGRSRRRSIRMQETLSTMELKEHERNNQQHRHKQRIIDTSSPRSDGMFLNSKPRASLRKSKGFLVASRNAQRHDIYDGSWRTNNAISSMYDCGRRGITNDLGAQRALQKKMQKHKQTMQNDWKNGGRLF